MAFECECGDPDTCTGQPDDTAAGVSQAQVVIAMHVITEQATLTTDRGSADDGMGYVDGYGIITGEQVRDIAERPETKVSYFPNPPTTQPDSPTDADTATAAEADGEPEPELDLDFVEAASPTVTDSESYETEPAAAADETEPAADTKPEPESSRAATPEPHAAPTTSEPEPEAEAATPPAGEGPDTSDALAPSPQPEPQLTPEAASVGEAEPQAPAKAEGSSEAPACYRKPKLPLPCLPSDPYRFSTAFDTYIRARDVACGAPGCDRPGFAAQLDHCQEYNHDDPAAGGQTDAANVHVLCVFHHLLKTGDHGWLDDMTLDHSGRVQYRVRTPEGLWIDGPDLSGTDLFDTLTRIRFADPPTTPTSSSRKKRSRRRSASTVDKQRRRQREREHNRAERETAEAAHAAAVEHDRITGEPVTYWRIRSHHPSHTSHTRDNEPLPHYDDTPPPF
ncbi:hypothetical protein HH308_14510 [Gordonia sp. TBRC 11910]|uniref:HNH nuclease domain-containing protein n=1 Tax=Gordonia asplenii TaxID=2725283 RepID=A0A848L474_9ACTN|nr:hypothetical protein [Gordonia asplenii]NMO02428.1 hypothetical protein [Gordonia asplenii]